MKSVRLVAVALVLAAADPVAGAQTSMPGGGSITPAMRMNPTAGRHDMAAHVRMDGAAAERARQPAGVPVQPDQSAFGAAQEIVRMLLADAGTDWSKSISTPCAST